MKFISQEIIHHILFAMKQWLQVFRILIWNFVKYRVPYLAEETSDLNGKFNVRDTRDRERVNPFIIKNPNSNHPWIYPCARTAAMLDHARLGTLLKRLTAHLHNL